MGKLEDEYGDLTPTRPKHCSALHTTIKWFPVTLHSASVNSTNKKESDDNTDHHTKYNTHCAHDKINKQREVEDNVENTSEIGTKDRQKTVNEDAETEF